MAEEVTPSSTKRDSDSLSDEHTIAAVDFLAKKSKDPTPVSEPELVAPAKAPALATEALLAEPTPLPPTPGNHEPLFSATELAEFDIDVLCPAPAQKPTEVKALSKVTQGKDPEDKRNTAPIRSDEVIKTLTKALDDDTIPDGDRTGVDRLIKVLSLPANTARSSRPQLHQLTLLDFPALASTTQLIDQPAEPTSEPQEIPLKVLPPPPAQETLTIVPPLAPPAVKSEPPAHRPSPPPIQNPASAPIAPSRITEPDEPEDEEEDEYGGLGRTMVTPVGPQLPPVKQQLQSPRFPTLSLLGLLAIILTGIVCVARFSGRKPEINTPRPVVRVPVVRPITPTKAPAFYEPPPPKLTAKPATLVAPEPKERLVYLYTLKKSDRTRNENTLGALAERFGCDAQSLANNNNVGTDLTAPLARNTTLWLPKNCPYDPSRGLHTGVVLGYLVTADEAPLSLKTVAQRYRCHEIGKLKRYLKANNATVDPEAIPAGTRVWLPNTLCSLEN